MADPCAECKHAKVPNAWGCAACGRIIEHPMLAENKKLRAELAAAQSRLCAVKAQITSEDQLQIHWWSKLEEP